MADDDTSTPRFETVSTSALQIKVRVARSPSPNPMTTKTLRSTSTTSRPSRLESRPPTRSNGNQLAVSSNRSQYSRSLSPRPQRTSEVAKPPPPSPSGLLPTRSPTPPNNQHHCHSVPNTPKIQSRRLEVPAASPASRGHLTPRSVSPRCLHKKKPYIRQISSLRVGWLLFKGVFLGFKSHFKNLCSIQYLSKKLARLLFAIYILWNYKHSS